MTLPTSAEGRTLRFTGPARVIERGMTRITRPDDVSRPFVFLKLEGLDKPVRAFGPTQVRRLRIFSHQDEAKISILLKPTIDRKGKTSYLPLTPAEVIPASPL